MPRTVSTWRGRYAREGLAGLADRRIGFLDFMNGIIPAHADKGIQEPVRSAPPPRLPRGRAL